MIQFNNGEADPNSCPAESATQFSQFSVYLCLQKIPVIDMDLQLIVPLIRRLYSTEYEQVLSETPRLSLPHPRTVRTQGE